MSLESIHNYYEHLVMEQIDDHIKQSTGSLDDDFIADVACVALNHLPSRYVRYDVDMVFYMPGEEREKMMAEVTEAVKKAWQFVKDHQK